MTIDTITAKTLAIVLAEDDDGHATLIERNLRRGGFNNEIIRTRDGQETLNLLQSPAGSSAKLEGDILLLLDINMPIVDGVDVLRALKSDAKTNMIPIIMLTTTDDPREVARCYQLGCNVYITKPVAYDAFTEAIRQLGLFLQVVKVPPVVRDVETKAS